jgi:preprotein translocase subunit SecE
MFYEPESEMTEEEMKEADPDGQQNFADQVMKEVNSATWPTPGAALREVGLLIAVVVATSAMIINWDNFLRDTYTNAGFIPTAEDIQKGGENMVLPEGWTKGMSEDDFMNFQDEVGSSAPSKSPSVSQFQDL